jgi:hypothetical protein
VVAIFLSKLHHHHLLLAVVEIISGSAAAGNDLRAHLLDCYRLVNKRKRTIETWTDGESDALTLILLIP